MEAILKRLVPRYAGAPRLLAYVLGVIAVGISLAVWQTGAWGRLTTVSFGLWLIISVAAELLWLETLSGDCTDSMASTANFAVIFLLNRAYSLWIIGISVLLATRYIQKRDWLRASFGLGQMVVTTFLASCCFHLIVRGPVSLESLHHPITGVAMVAAGAAYFFVNTWLVAGAVSLERGTGFWTTWRQNYAYRNSVVTAVALFSLSPLLVLSFLSLGYPGVLLFFVPLLIIKNQNREYIDLQKMTRALISSERMAAKGEMAAEVAHEINNYLAVLSGRTQLLLMKASRSNDEKLKNDAEIIQQQIQRMNTLAKGLLDFSHKGIRIQSFDFNKLITDTVEFVRPQNLFDACNIEVDLDPEVGLVEADAGQLQQVLINLLRNAAEAMRDSAAGRGAGGEAPASASAAGTPEEGAAKEEGGGRIRVSTAVAKKGFVRLSVRDNGPGISKGNLNKIFEPGITNKPYGHGYGLATCYRILQSHGGRIWAESEPEGGAAFRLEFPRRANDQPVATEVAPSKAPAAPLPNQERRATGTEGA